MIKNYHGDKQCVLYQKIFSHLLLLFLFLHLIFISDCNNWIVARFVCLFRFNPIRIWPHQFVHFMNPYTCCLHQKFWEVRWVYLTIELKDPISYTCIFERHWLKALAWLTTVEAEEEDASSKIWYAKRFF